MDLVSIIIPIYNVEKYIHRCIESVISQTYQNLEIILVDDGSSDNCGKICDEYAKKDNRIKVIHKKNGGLSDARNAGLDIVSGKYVYFLDGDDYIQFNLVETVVKHLVEGADMVVFNYQKVFVNGNIQLGSSRKKNTFDLIDEQGRFDFIIQNALRYSLGWEAWNRIYRRDMIEQYNLHFVDNQKIFAEDLYFFICYCAHVKKIESIPDVLYNYVIREDSIMQTQASNLNVGRMNELSKELYGFLKQWEDCSLLIQNYPALHFMIINNALAKVIAKIDSNKLDDFREMVLADIADIEFFEKQVKCLFRIIKILEPCYTGLYLAETLNVYKFLLDGSAYKFKLRNKVLYSMCKFVEYNFVNSKINRN